MIDDFTVVPYSVTIVTVIFDDFTGCAIQCCAIQCYQCDSNEDMSCKSYEKFDTEINAPVDCNSFEANTPGQFCMKIVQESPGWRGWKKITRRCGSRTDLGVAWGCRWSWDTVGVFKEICYCESDRCNTATISRLNMILATATVLLSFLIRKIL
ncbi:hypothetical protein FSP39_019861 [Pinctada imbricata]|uniref:UPAR/Ly6 domain-containing protein qvr n=1 Tax=Pinctada imbricata TaxID=66713 RepID=A0AA89BUM2_PINIB|nr:hypothetical protein FSP39_019861 [Pinctada imbricata]